MNEYYFIHKTCLSHLLWCYFLFLLVSLKINSHKKQRLPVCHDIQKILSSNLQKLLIGADIVLSDRHGSSVYTNTFACQSSFKRLHDHSQSVSRASFVLHEDRAVTRQVTWPSGLSSVTHACRLSFLADHAQNFPWVIIHVWSFTLRLKNISNYRSLKLVWKKES